MFRLELVPAAHGDAIRIEHGDPKKPRRIVIDGVPAATHDAGLRERGSKPASKDRCIRRSTFGIPDAVPLPGSHP